MGGVQNKSLAVPDTGVVGGGRGDHPPPLVAENVVCSNSNFSPTGAITPDHPPPPPFRKSRIRA